VAILYAHRGASTERPENTLVAFRRALEIGADALELDVHMTADGHVIVAHDDSAARMCGVDRTYKRSTLEEVKAWDAGHGFAGDLGDFPFRGCGVTVPTLIEVLEEFSDVPLNIDLKQTSPNIVSTTLHLLRRYRAEERVTLASFRWRTLVDVRVRGYRGRTSLSRAESIALITAKAAFRMLPLTGTVAQLPVSYGPLRIGRRTIIERCHELNLKVDFWTVNDPLEAEELIAMGADGIMSDDPKALVPLFRGHYSS
jgi:glycerophosphoryl diester phosphodiesterase